MHSSAARHLAYSHLVDCHEWCCRECWHARFQSPLQACLEVKLRSQRVTPCSIVRNLPNCFFQNDCTIGKPASSTLSSVLRIPIPRDFAESQLTGQVTPGEGCGAENCWVFPPGQPPWAQFRPSAWVRYAGHRHGAAGSGESLRNRIYIYTFFLILT